MVEDFHYESLHSQIQPLVVSFLRFPPRQIAVRLPLGPVNEQLETIRRTWNEFVPQQPFNFVFLDQRLQAWYTNEEQVANLFNVFTILAIVIACLGLFGLAAYIDETRTKEIGVPKILGASVTCIFPLLSKDFVKLVLPGFVIATPIAWYAMNRWLEDFAYRIEIGPGVFLLAGLAAVLIALATVSWQSVRAAVANPVNSLRSE